MTDTVIPPSSGQTRSTQYNYLTNIPSPLWGVKLVAEKGGETKPNVVDIVNNVGD